MTDHPRSPDDNLLRGALRAEADDVHADDALLARIRSATAPPPAWRRRTPMLAMAAAIAIVAGLAAVLLTRDDETVVLEDPERPAGPADDLRDLLGGLIPCGSVPGIEEPAVQVVVFRLPVIAPSATIGPDDELNPVTTPGLAPDSRQDVHEEVDQLLATLGIEPAYQMGRSLVLQRLLEANPDSALVAGLADLEVPDALVISMASPAEATALLAQLSDLPGVWATSSTDCRDQRGTTVDPVPTSVLSGGDRPTLVALVREDGWLVTVDLETGEQRELHTEGDPRQAEPGLEEGGPYFIDAVDLSPDGEWIYFSTCCEPADGMTFRIPTEGGEVEEVGFGAYPRTSPDRGFVATAGSAHLRVYRIDDLGLSAKPAILEIGCCAKHLAWSPDGTELALVYGTGAEGEVPQVRRFSWDGTTLAELEMGKPENPGWFVLWMPDGMPMLFNGDPVADDRYLSQDPSHQWILWVDEEGVVKEQAGFETGDVTPIRGLPEALAADW